MTLEEVQKLPIGAVVEARSVPPWPPECWRLVIIGRELQGEPYPELVEWDDRTNMGSAGTLFCDGTLAPINILADDLQSHQTQRIA
jgi:hypothetical protein